MLHIGPPKPRYTHTWDVCLVQKYLDCLGKTNLLPLSSSQSNWQCFLPFPVRNEPRPSQSRTSGTAVLPQKEFSFTLVSPRKRGSPHQHPRAFFASFPHNERLCPISTLRPYLKATQNIHPVFLSSKPDPLFLMSNYIIVSLRPLLADSCAWS